MKKPAIVVAALSFLIAATQVTAGERNACLQRNRLHSWRVVDQNTLEMTDRSRNSFHVTFRNACPVATQPAATLIFGSAWRNLQCLGPGMPVNVTARGHGLRTCRVASVTAG